LFSDQMGMLCLDSFHGFLNFKSHGRFSYG
jgi:hypothetical protein